MPEGIVKWYDATKKTGFITPADGGGDVFVRPESGGPAPTRAPAGGEPERFDLRSLENRVAGPGVDIHEGQRVTFETGSSESGRITAFSLRALPTD